GLTIATAFVLLYIAYDTQTVRYIIPIDFKILGASGVLIAVLTGSLSLLGGNPILTQTTSDVHLPRVGDLHLATAVLFDIGVFLAVIGTAMTIIKSISEDE